MMRPIYTSSSKHQSSEYPAISKANSDAMDQALKPKADQATVDEALAQKQTRFTFHGPKQLREPWTKP